MGVIQSSINQMLGTAGIAARLSPGYEKRQKLHELKQEEKVLNQQGASAKLIGKDAKDPDTLRSLGNIKERQMDLASQQFQLNPNEESFNKMIQLQKSYRSFNNYEALMQRQQEALRKVAEKQEAQLHQKRNFLSYLGRQPISGGIKRLMDTIDMENKK